MFASAFRKKSVLSAQAAAKQTTAPTDGLIHISQHGLIQCRHQTSQLVLSSRNIKAMQSGAYLSSFRGRGMEFNESRSYQPGDDIRSMDWKVTARTGTAHTKVFSEEKERPVLCWADFREPMRFATHGVFKSVIAAKAAASIAWAANAQGDRIGGLVFSEHTHQELKPQRGKTSVLHFIKQLEQIQNTDSDKPGSQINAEQALARLRRVARPGSLIFLLSDFRNLGEQALSHITQLSRHNDIVMFFIYDTLEKSLPPSGQYLIEYQDKTLRFSTHNNSQAQYQQHFTERLAALKDFAVKHRISLIECSTEQNPLQQLQSSFR
ncbi:MAG: DUF58 domain-containing protein [Gammaproteobacteria bacterium]|nr:DUF58 domain-containing protein [Gammaproteobacteria bacterium]